MHRPATTCTPAPPAHTRPRPSPACLRGGVEVDEELQRGGVLNGRPPGCGGWQGVGRGGRTASMSACVWAAPGAAPGIFASTSQAHQSSSPCWLARRLLTRRHLYGAQVFAALIQARAHKIKGQALQRQLHRLRAGRGVGRGAGGGGVSGHRWRAGSAGRDVQPSLRMGVEGAGGGKERAQRSKCRRSLRHHGLLGYGHALQAGLQAWPRPQDLRDASAWQRPSRQQPPPAAAVRTGCRRTSSAANAATGRCAD